MIFLAFFNILSNAQTSAKVERIEFEGNKFYSQNELLKMMATKAESPFSEIQFELDLKNIIKNYQNSGYINCSIENVEKNYNFDSSSINLSIKINEGKQTFIGEILFEGNKVFQTKFLMNLMDSKAGEVLDAFKLNRDITDILNLYEQKGYTFASISIKNIEEYSENGTDKIRITIKIDENEKIKIDKISIEGNTTTKDNVIVREISLEDIKSLTKENLLEIKQRLDNTGYFESVEMPKIYKYKNSTVLQINVKEGNTNTFDGILGYVPPAQNEESGYFTGLVNLSLRNLFGTGRRIDARFHKEQRETQELEIRYLEPWVLGLPVNISGGFLQRIEDSSYIKRDVSLKTETLLSRKFSVSVLFNAERVIPTLENNQIYSIFDSRLLATGVEIKFDSRDYVYNPFSGILYKTSYSVGQKKVYNASSFPNQDIPGDFTIQKGTVDLDFYHSFFKRQSLLLSVHGVEIRSPRFETADLFRLGGNRSVRGYRESQFLASRVGWSNVELRYSLTRKSFGAVFYDFGYYLRPADEIAQIPSQEAFIFGYGLGIRIETALGMFGVSYALGRGDSILEGKVHFGLVNDF
ncbi:MAG: BamA/TamA family outer membrane protein [Chlorobi bacterium]|nr:BamA/TamA family outer membrane protein [Chlorobiota bacterium]